MDADSNAAQARGREGAERGARAAASDRAGVWGGAPLKDEASLFDGIDTSIAGLAKFAGPRPPKDLTDGVGVIARAVQSAQKAFDSESDAATLKPLFDG